MKENLEKLDGVEVAVCYNKIYDFWKGAGKAKGLFANVVKYGVFIISILSFMFKKKENIDIIFPQALVFPTVFALFVRKFYAVPMVSYVHGGDVNVYPNASAFYKLIMRKALQHCDSVIVNSKDIYHKVLDIFHHPDIKIISPGVDIAMMKKIPTKARLRKEHNLPQDKFILLTAGNAIRRKGFDIFLQAVVKLDDSILNKTYTLIVAEGPERKKLQKFIDTNHLKNHVRITDKVDQKKLNEYYNTADVFIFPSREEPLGLVGLEAMTTGIPVIGAKVGGIPDYLKHKYNGLLFEPENATDLSVKISKLINNPGLYRELSKNTSIYPKKYSITEAAKKLKKHFLELRADR